MDRDIICGLLGRSNIKFNYDGKCTVTVENKNVWNVRFEFDGNGQLIKVEPFDDDEL